jgi:hypothetical protein
MMIKRLSAIAMGVCGGALFLAVMGISAVSAPGPVVQAASESDPGPDRGRKATDTPQSTQPPTATATPRAPTATPEPTRQRSTPPPSPTTQAKDAPTSTREPTRTREPTATPKSPPPPTPTPRPPSPPAGGSGDSGQQSPKATFVPESAPAAASRAASTPAPVVVAPAPQPLPQVTFPPEAFRFVLGFADLKAQLGLIMGEPVEAEHGVAENCDTQQLTTTGLAYWRCSSGTLGFVAFPDGVQHWALTPLGLATWSGDAPDPPEDATILPNGQLSSATPTAVGQEQQVCVQPGEDPLTACVIGGGSSVLGYVTSAGGTHAYRFEIGPNGANVLASLVDLPADYDLYLVDGLAQVLASSVEEGAAPESIGLTLGQGNYLLYVHSDVGRPVAPDVPYRLELGLEDGAAAAAAEQVDIDSLR